MAAQNYNLTQTGEEVQEILNNATPVTDLQQETQARQQADTLLQQNIDAEATARQQAVSALAAQIAQTLTDYYQKSETMSATEIQTLVAETIAAYYTKLQVDALIQDFITASVSNLTNYYLKTETFTKTEVQQLIAAVKQFRYQSVATLPTASAETMNIIYLVPSANPKAENVKDEYITTSQTNEQGVTTYDWEQIGSTTVDLSGYSTTEQMNAAISQAIATALAQYYTKSETMSTAQVNAAIEQAVNTALANYYTKTQTDAAINAALNSALTTYYTKTEVNALLDTIRQSVTAETNARTDADATLRGLIQQVSASLANYYLKTETYSRSEVQQLIDTVKQFQYVVAASLPANPGPDTMGIIYLIPSTNPKAENVKDEFITVLDGSTYKWEQIGSTTVDLSGYPTTAEMNAAIASALTAYYTQAQVDSMVASINAAIESATGRVFFIEKSFGKYDGEREITLQQAKADKYVNTDGGETSASGYGISTPITLNAGDILLIPSAQAVPASVSVVARMVDRTYQKVIAYIYTYREDYPELPATATADYDASLVYTAVYDESSDTPTLTGWTRAGQTYTTLPATREVSEQFYEPLMKQAVSAMPSTGYYIYLSPTAMTVVVSGLAATVSGGTAPVVGWGIFKNITTNFVGAPGQSVLAQAFAVLFAAIDGLKAQLENLGETKAVSIDFENAPKLCGQDMFLTGDGAPVAPNVPTMVGHEYLDVTNKKCYKAFSVTNSVSDWVLLN